MKRLLAVLLFCPALLVGQTTFTGGGTGTATDTASISARIDAIAPDTLGWFNVKAYGAVGNGTANDAAAIQAAISAARTAKGGTVYFPIGTYKVSSTLDVTVCENITFQGQGRASEDGNPAAVLRLSTTGTPGLDLSGSGRLTFRDMFIDCATGTAAPKVMVLQARVAEPADHSGAVTFINSEFWSPAAGTTCRAVIYNWGSEVNTYFNTALLAQNDSCTALWFTGVNDLAMTSAFVTLTTGEISASVLRFFGGAIGDYSTGQQDTSGRCVYLHNSMAVVFDGVWFSSNATQFIKVLSDTASTGPVIGISVNNCRMEPYPGSNPKFAIKATLRADAGSFHLNSFMGNYGTCDSSVIEVIGGANTVFQPGNITGNRFYDDPPVYMINAPSSALTRGGIIDAEGLLVNLNHWTPSGTFVTGRGVNQYAELGGSPIVTKGDTTALFVFSGGGGNAGDTASITTSTIYGSFFNEGYDTLVVTSLMCVLQHGIGTDTLGIQVSFNDSLNAGIVTNLLAATFPVNSITAGNEQTTITTAKIPPNVFVWCKSPTVVTARKPTYMSVTMSGYRLKP
jgi:hypothetical protein